MTIITDSSQLGEEKDAFWSLMHVLERVGITTPEMIFIDRFVAMHTKSTQSRQGENR